MNKNLSTEPLSVPTLTRSEENLERIAADPALRQQGWDSYGALPLDDRAVEAARAFLRYQWDACPTNDGGVQLERHHSNGDIEVTFEADGTLSDVFVQPAEVDALLRAREQALREIVEMMKRTTNISDLDRDLERLGQLLTGPEA